MFGWFRKRTPAPLPTIEFDPRMSDDWHVGDVAVCITSDWCTCTGQDPRKGDRLTVSHVLTGLYIGDINRGGIGLSFAEKPADMAWHNLGFRKLRPDARAAESTFTAWLKETLRVPVT